MMYYKKAAWAGDIFAMMNLGTIAAKDKYNLSSYEKEYFKEMSAIAFSYGVGNAGLK